MSLSDSDIEERMKRISLAHEGYNIPNSTCKPEIEKFYDDIHTNIEDLNQKLIGLFKKKEDDLCNMYKREMTKAQKRLRELQECTSEQELNKRKIEKKEKLQKERQKFLETSIYFQNQCKEFKSTLTKVVNTTKDLEGEVNFLNEQVVFADRHNQKLTSELDQLKSEIYKYDPNAKLDNLEDVFSLQPLQNNQNEGTNIHNSSQNSQPQQINNSSILTHNKFGQNVDVNNLNYINNTQNMGSLLQGSSIIQHDNTILETNFNNSKSTQMKKYVSPYNKKQIMRPVPSIDQADLEKAKQELKRQKEINEKLSEFLNDPCFQETEFEQIFMDCVTSVKEQKQKYNMNHKLPYLKNKDKKHKNMDMSNPSLLKANDSTLDFTTISELDFNEFNKRQILEEFLSNEEIKKYLYTLIFRNNNSNGKNSNQTPLKQEASQKSEQSIEKEFNKKSRQMHQYDQERVSEMNILDGLKQL